MPVRNPSTGNDPREGGQIGRQLLVLACDPFPSEEQGVLVMSLFKATPAHLRGLWRNLPAAGFWQTWFRSGAVRPSPRSTEGPGTHRWRPCLRGRAEGTPSVSVGSCGRSPLGVGVHAPPGDTPQSLELCLLVTAGGGGTTSLLCVEAPWSAWGQP